MGQKNDNHDQDCTVYNDLILLKIVQPLQAHKRYQNRAHKRPPDRVHSSQSNHDDQFDGEEKIKGRRVDKIHVVGIKTAGQRGQNGGIDENDDLVFGNIDPHGAGGRFTGVNCAQGAPGRRLDQPDGKQKGGQHHGPHQVVVLFNGIELKSQKAHCRNTDHSVRSAGPFDFFPKDDIDNDPKRKGGHGQIITPQAQGRSTHHQCHRGGRNHSKKHAHPRVQTEADRKDAGDIGPDSEKGGMSQGDLAGISH